MRQSLLFLLLTLFTAGALAEAPPYNRVSLSEQASTELENDRMVAILFAQAEGHDTVAPAREVNRTVRQAVNKARQRPGIEVSTLNYRTQPVYEKGRIVRWRVTQQVRLESHEGQALGKLIGELQSDSLRVQSLGYRLSEEKRRQHIDEVIEQALQRFTHRAQRIAATLGRKGYRLVRLSVNEGRPGPTPVRLDAMVADTPLARRAGPVTIESRPAPRA
ncbi:SIMPL domain-containing protein [endosymbiont of unidentified scaly snail isolate Monju]|uniref:SIMPL domain-containing protein n=1 Tax=endosymbiont of unidentified scaly snail isolate Monju TaxID=1248727 RepID=UPI00038927FB|nr:SIMPL domain-containing protein [endosymbiont of unidentified scaly snail isolate Monju]BAN69862.1 conserved hypothetical protein [endosymbiont of unidentified scaly snail isolate Monju]